MEPILKVSGVTKDYDMGEVVVHALRGVDFELYAGEFVVVLGPSGSGKSTVLNIIGGIDKPTEGSVIYNDKDISKQNDKQLTKYRREAVGFVFQFYNLIPNLTAKENVELAAQLKVDSLNIDELLEQVGMLDRADHFPSQLSGGQQQRVAIARALSKNPDILLCDEPTGALDISTGVQVLEVLLDFNKKYNKTVVVITHNEQISMIADRVFYVKDGVIDKIIVNENPKQPNEVTW